MFPDKKEAVNFHKLLGVLILFAPILNIYGVSGVGLFDILIIALFPLLVRKIRIAPPQFLLLYTIIFCFLLSGLFGGLDLVGVFQVGKFLFYLVVGLSIRSYFKDYDLGSTVKICLVLVAAGFGLQLVLMFFGIYESLVFSSLGLVNDHLNSTDLNLYMSKDARLTSFFVEPAHLSVWLIFLSGILISREQLSTKWLLLILTLLFLSGSSFGFGFGVYLLIHVMPTKYRVFFLLFSLFSLMILLIQLDMNQVANQVTNLGNYAPQISRLIENDAAVTGRTGSVNIMSMTWTEILVGSGIVGTEGYIPFFVRMISWGGISCLVLIYLNFKWIVFQNNSTKDMLIVITVLVFFSGILSTVYLILLFLIMPNKNEDGTRGAGQMKELDKTFR